MSEKQRKNIYITLTAVLFQAVILICIWPYHASGTENEETYAISLVQTAEVDTEVVKVEDRKVVTETYTIQEGEHIWKILRNRGLLEKHNLMEILTILKKLNSSFTNLDIVHPGEKIIIPLVITPLGADEDIPDAVYAQAPVSLESIENIELYTVRPGDSIIRILKELYDLPEENLYDGYVEQLKKLNPDIRDVNRIYPGQRIRLPVYTPGIVRAPIKKPEISAEQEEARKKEIPAIGEQLGEIFSLVGEEWVQKGQHFIPLQTGGQVSLNADSYPVLNLRSGNKIILDLYNELPDRMADLIMSNWDNYRIVRLERGDNLAAIIDSILSQAGYSRVYKKSESYTLDRDITITINADWIIRLFAEATSESENIVVLNLIHERSGKTPDSIRSLLRQYGITAIDYPARQEKDPSVTAEIIEAGSTKNHVTEKLLDLVGQTYTARPDIPLYQRDQADFRAVLSADYLIDLGGKMIVIDLHGMGKDVTDLLKEHSFQVLSLGEVHEPVMLSHKILDLLDINFTSGRQSFFVTEREETRNIRITLNGIIFKDKDNRDIFATDLKLPAGLMQFIAAEGRKILQLPDGFF